MANTLVSVETLAAHIDDPTWRVFDCRHDLGNTEYGAQAYAKGHIPGALFLHCDRDLSGLHNGKNGRHPLPDIETFAKRMSECGITPDTQVVAYDNEASAFAARLWWMLRWLGHDKVALLDGGLPGWKRAKLPLVAAETEVRSVAPSQFVARPRAEMLVDTSYVQQHFRSPSMLLLDGRSEERFAGQNETLDPVAGHIPGSINRFYYDCLDDAAIYFKTADELRAEFVDLLGDRDPRTVVQVCGSGVTACVNLLGMEIAGLHGSKLYAGSWSEWCSDAARPAATGDQPG
jgi:thiosulfate/3-mercaptopyruvate sulfurtransferase